MSAPLDESYVLEAVPSLSNTASKNYYIGTNFWCLTNHTVNGSSLSAYSGTGLTIQVNNSAPNLRGGNVTYMSSGANGTQTISADLQFQNSWITIGAVSGGLQTLSTPVRWMRVTGLAANLTGYKGFLFKDMVHTNMH